MFIRIDPDEENFNIFKEINKIHKHIKKSTYCLGCKDFTHRSKNGPQEVKMTNKVLREKSDCVACWSNKSRFLKQKHHNKK